MAIIEEIIEDDPPAQQQYIPEMLRNMIPSENADNLLQNKNLPKTIQIVPEPCFVLKLKTNNNEKIFANICSHESIPAPIKKSEAQIQAFIDEILKEDESENSTTQIDYKVPVSIGEKHIESDKSGNLCNCYDLVFSPEFTNQCKKSTVFHQYLIHYTFMAIMQKYGHELDGNFCVKLKNKNYFGSKIQETTVADRSNKADIQVEKVAKIEVKKEEEVKKSPEIKKKNYIIFQESANKLVVKFKKIENLDSIKISVASNRILIQRKVSDKILTLHDLWFENDQLFGDFQKIPGNCRSYVENGVLSLAFENCEVAAC